MNRVDQADVLFVNGKVITVDPQDRIAEAVAVRAGRIYAVGSNEEIRRLAGPETEVVDLKGRPLLPAFTDCHTHLEMASVGLGLMVDIHVPPCKNIPDMLEALRQRASETPEGEWIFGMGNLYHDFRLPEKRFPTREELDTVSTRHKIVTRLGGHVTVMNSLAMEALGITRDIVPPPGAYVERDADGNPTGQFRDFTWNRLGIPEFSMEEKRRAIVQTAYDYFIKRGVTAIGDVSETREGNRTIQELCRSGEIPLRVGTYVWVPRTMSLEDLLGLGMGSGFGDDHFYLAGIKLFADGGLSARLAALHEPYVGTDDRGVLNWTVEEFAELVRRSNEAGLQIMTHCCGDRAMDMVIDAYRNELDARPRSDHRWRIEHAGNLFGTDERLKRMRDLDIVPVPQPPHLYSVGDHYESLVGPERMKTAYRFRTMVEMGFKLPGNSDLTSSQPESSNPLYGIWHLVCRRTYQGNLINPEERISVRDAIRAYTYNSAWVIGQERIRGSIEPGKLADLVVLDRDPLTVPEDSIKDIRVDMTYVDGVCVYKR